MSNTHFFNQEDAERHAIKYGGKVMDNTHNNNEWVGNNYTVSKNELSINNEPINALYDIEEPEYMGHVTMSKEEHEFWMQIKKWSEDLKERHRDEFERCIKNWKGEINMWFNGRNSFNYL